MTYENEYKQIEKEMEEKIDNPQQAKFGLFKDFYKGEVHYHQHTLLEMFKEKKFKEKLLKNLLGDDYQDDIEIIRIEKEYTVTGYQKDETGNYITNKDGKKEKKKKDIDLYLELSSVANNWTNEPIIIELKTNSDNHGGQLTFYYDIIFEQTNKNPHCFYVSLDGRAPIKKSKDNERKDIIEKYICKKYSDLVKNIHTCDTHHYAFKDYINTINLVEEIKNEQDECIYNTGSSKNNLKDNIQKDNIYKQVCIYNTYFVKLKEELLEKNIKSKITFKIGFKTKKNSKPGKRPKELNHSYKEDFNFKDIYEDLLSRVKMIEKKGYYTELFLKLVIWDKDKYLALERRWENTGSSFIYGVSWGSQNRNYIIESAPYENLLSFWKEILGRTLFTKYIEGYKTGYVQDLTDWPMPFLDHKKIFIGETDVRNWANWIKEDLDRIQ